jgi:VanZ family protein
LNLTLINQRKAGLGFLKSTLSALIIAMCIAILDELNQATVAGRNASLLDILLDGMGIIIALWILNSRLILGAKKN